MSPPTREVVAEDATARSSTTRTLLNSQPRRPTGSSAATTPAPSDHPLAMAGTRSPWILVDDGRCPATTARSARPVYAASSLILHDGRRSMRSGTMAGAARSKTLCVAVLAPRQKRSGTNEGLKSETRFEYPADACRSVGRGVETSRLVRSQDRRLLLSDRVAGAHVQGHPA